MEFKISEEPNRTKFKSLVLSYASRLTLIGPIFSLSNRYHIGRAIPWGIWELSS